MLPFRAVLLGAVVPLFTGCVPSAPPPSHVQVPPRGASESASPLPTPHQQPPPHALGRELALEEGPVSFEGMVRPTKGGFEVRGVLLDTQEFLSRIAPSPSGTGPSDSQALLGAVVRVTATLHRHQDPSEPSEGALAVQSRTGDSFASSQLKQVEVLAIPVVVEGTLRPSKGLFSVGPYLVSRDDLAWALRGAKAGMRVRLWGQPRRYICHPNEQCLLEGELPLFEVGRAQQIH